MEGFDEEEFKKFFPSGFGKQTKEADIKTQIDRTKRKAAVETSNARAIEKASGPSQESTNDKDDAGSDADSDSDSDGSDDEFPVSHNLVFKTHERAVTTITLDTAGARMITGSTDCTVKFHDFASLTPSTLRAFKSVEPNARKNATSSSEIHPVHIAKFNPISPSQILVVSATPQAKVLSRDGDTLAEFVKGDMYLRDMKNTKGHISEVTSGTWSPSDYNLCVTAGTDSTLRIWDVNDPRSQKEVIVHRSRAAGSAGRSRMTAVAWASPAQGGPNALIASALDGSLVMWGGDGPFNRPSAEIKDAHTKDTWTSGLDISPDGRLKVQTTYNDGLACIRIEILPYIKHTVLSERELTSSRGSEDRTSAYIESCYPQTPKMVTLVTPDSPLISVYWHEKLNQIITGSANAETHLLYNPSLSHNGALMIMSKAPKRRHVDDDPNFTTDISLGFSGEGIVNGSGIAAATSFAARHPTVGLTASGRSRDPRRPHVPAQTPFAKSQPDEKHIKDNIPLSSMRDEDPREALLKYAEAAEKEPIFTHAWKHTQPKTIYAELSDDDEEEESKRPGPDKKRIKRNY
ncbi:WD repeat protein [Microsporum canis CBS 113480]|uniref:WD repeat protein n=1 Tax=Arthroderma otae (strain ATCC MYA-4605 / CBS 113480) TaxID=554155 RepID=C5FW57_ARTOC|nr:WD repeat protein [Microsporum canis CBS 113480]EEQ34141.1 WD repeat protein [Microsporum canis CBS 113480]